jgi:hypothetical protein
MIAGNNNRSNFFLILTVIFCFIISGCGGGGGGSALTGATNTPDYAPFSFKLQMLGSTSNAPGYLVPSSAAGDISVTVTSLKDAARKISKSVSYNAGYMVFENELLANDTYSVSVTAKLKTSSGDTLEVWSGGSPHFKLSSNDELLKNPEINTLNIGLVFSHHETIQIVPSSIVFDPALPVTGLTPGASIPSFSVKMTDQYGFAILNAPSPVTVSLVNGTLIGEISAQVVNGAASFSQLSVSSLLPDAAGNVYLKATYGAYSALSQAIKASITDAPNTTLAGYLDFTFNDKSAALRSPIPGRACSIAVEGRLYETVTDSNGFYKFDVLINASPTIAKLSVIGPSGNWDSTETLLSASKLYAANITFSSPDRGCLAMKDIGAFGGVMPLELLKQQLDSKIAEIRRTSSGALTINGRVINKQAASGEPVSGISGAIVSVSPGGASTQTDAAGFFKLNGPFAEGAYRVEAVKTGYSFDDTDIYISSNDYGFDYSGLTFKLAPIVVVKQLVSISISPSSASLLTGQQYALSSINSVAAYSDGTSAPVTPVWSIKSGGGEIYGSYFTAPAQARTVILTASHSEAGIVKTVDFNITVNAKVTLSSLILNKEKDSMLTNSVYDLGLIKAAAYYSDNSSREVAVSWRAANGGTISAGNKYSPPDAEGVYILEAAYTEDGETKTAILNLVVTKQVVYEGIVLSSHTDTIEVGASYDLSVIRAFAVYSNLTTKEISVVWSVDPSHGTLSGNIYTAPAATGYYVIDATYTENGVSKETALVMSVINSKPVPAVTARIISENTVRLDFSENIDISGFNPSKIIINSAPLTSADRLEIKSAVSQSAAFLTLANDFSIEDQQNGIAASSGRGIELIAGCGIKSSATGVEAVTGGAIALAKDETPPPAPDSLILSKLMFSSGQGFILAVDSIKYIEMSRLEFYAGASAPDSSTQPAASEILPVKGHAKNDIIISGFTPISGGNIYYRLKDRAGNLSQWSAHGVIPAPPAVENMTWSNAARAFKVGGAPLGGENDRVFVYYTTPAGAIMFKGNSYSAPAGGFASGTSVVISETALDSGTTIMYSIVSHLNVESLIIADGIVPAPPVEITGQMRLRYNIPNYALTNISTTSSVTLLNDLRVIIETIPGAAPSEPMILGRIRKSTVIGAESTPSTGSYLSSESKDINGLFEFPTAGGGVLKLSYVVPANEPSGAGNESSLVTSIPGNGVPGPAPAANISWDDTAMSVKITGSGFGFKGDIIKVYEITASGETLYVGSSEEAPDGGFILDASYYVGNRLSASTNSVAFAVLSADKNEGKINKKQSLLTPGLK